VKTHSRTPKTWLHHWQYTPGRGLAHSRLQLPSQPSLIRRQRTRFWGSNSLISRCSEVAPIRSQRQIYPHAWDELRFFRLKSMVSGQSLGCPCVGNSWDPRWLGYGSNHWTMTWMINFTNEFVEFVGFAGSFPGKHGPPVKSCETAAVLHNASWWAGVAGWKHTWVSVPLGVGAYTFLGTNLVCCACCNFSLCRQVCSNIPVMENNFNTQMSVTVWLYLPETSDSWQPDCPNQAWKFFFCMVHICS
jgi:hypothetical protein